MLQTGKVRPAVAFKEERLVDAYEWIDNEFPVDAPIGQKIRVSGRLQCESVGGHESGNGKSGERAGRGDSSGKTGEEKAGKNG